MTETLFVAEAKRAWLYCRSAGSCTDALGAQKECLMDYAGTHGFQVVGITAEIEGGTRMCRKGIWEITAAVKHGLLDTLILKNPGRLARCTQDALEYIYWLEQQHVDVVFTDATDLPAKKIIPGQLLAALERYRCNSHLPR